MPKVLVSELQPDMILAEDLRGPAGQFLLPKGTVIHPGVPARLCKWGLGQIEVEVCAGQDACHHAEEVVVSPAMLAACRELQTARMIHFGQPGPFATWLREAASLHMARSLTRKHQKPPSPVMPSIDPLLEDPFPPEARSAPTPTALIDRDPALASLPDVFMRINEVLNNPHSTQAQAADVIGKDQSLSAKLLKLVNSAFYGLPSPVDTLTRAVTLIGSKQLTTLALGISVTTLFKDIPAELVNMKDFWKHSIAVGVMARVLSMIRGEEDTERFFVAGLLHDLGRLILFKSLPRHAAVALFTARKTGQLLHVAEFNQLGYSHGRVGGALLRKWRFPEFLETCVSRHHEPEKAGLAPHVVTIQVADSLAVALHARASGEWFIPPVEERIFAQLRLTPKTLDRCLEQVDLQLEEILQVFLPSGA